MAASPRSAAQCNAVALRRADVGTLLQQVAQRITIAFHRGVGDRRAGRGGAEDGGHQDGECAVRCKTKFHGFLPYVAQGS
jgi:hypothetical protein